MKTTRLMVDGMRCANCEKHVAEALKAVPGVQEVNVDRVFNAAIVEHADDANVRAMVSAVTEEGYGAHVAD